MIQNVAKVSSMYPNPLGSSLIKEYDHEAFKNERIMKHKLTCFYLLIAIRILYGILAKVCRMLTNLLGSSWSNLFTETMWETKMNKLELDKKWWCFNFEVVPYLKLSTCYYWEDWDIALLLSDYQLPCLFVWPSCILHAFKKLFSW